MIYVKTLYTASRLYSLERFTNRRIIANDNPQRERRDSSGVGGVLPTVPITRNASNAIKFVQQRLDKDGQCCYPGCFKPCVSAGVPNQHETSGDLELDFGLQILRGLHSHA